jgi:threonine/homoserine/homoserine lactone efflux protein
MGLPDLRSLALFMAAALALNLTPGPDMLYVAARSASQGRKAGIASALGIATGLLVHITVVAFGLAAFLAAVPIANNIVRLAGAAYLVYLGLRTLLRPRALSTARVEAAKSLTSFSQGMLTNLLNPKVALFFLAFLPQFVDPARGSMAGQVVALGLLFNTSGTLVNLVVALGVSRAAASIGRHERATVVIQRVSGSLLIALGLRLAIARTK